MFRIIQIGIGGMGNAWIRAIHNDPDVAFAALVEVDDAIITQQTQQYGFDSARIYRSLPDALANVEADGVLIVTPPQFHRPLSEIALDAGLPVLCEKPLAGTLEDASAIARKADETGVLHVVTQNYRYQRSTQTLKSVLASGHLGEISAASIQFFKGPRFAGFRTEMPYPLVIDMAIHHFDLLRYFLECEPVSLYGRSYNPPWSWFRGDAAAAVVFNMEGGAVVSYNGSWVSMAQETTWNGHWRFEGEKGVVIMENDEVYVQLWTGVQSNNGFPANSHTERVRVEPVSMPREAQSYLLREFVEAVRGGPRPSTICQDNLRTMQMVFGVVESFKTGGVVQPGGVQ